MAEAQTRIDELERELFRMTTRVGAVESGLAELKRTEGIAIPEATMREIHHASPRWINNPNPINNNHDRAARGGYFDNFPGRSTAASSLSSAVYSPMSSSSDGIGVSSEGDLVSTCPHM